MDRRKIKEFQNLIENNNFQEASELIPDLLDWKKYSTFCEKVRKYLCKEDREKDAWLFQLAQIQAIFTEEIEQKKIKSEAYAEETRQSAEKTGLIYNDALSSFEMLSQKASKVFNGKILSFAMELIYESSKPIS